MISIEKFIFNPFQENTFLLYDETRECILVDPGCYSVDEKKELVDFVHNHNLKPVRQIYTHCHVDHILGNNFIFETFHLRPEIHEAGLKFLQHGHIQGQVYGFQMDQNTEPEKFIEHDEVIRFGNSSFKAVYTPGQQSLGCSPSPRQHLELAPRDRRGITLRTGSAGAHLRQSGYIKGCLQI